MSAINESEVGPSVVSLLHSCRPLSCGRNPLEVLTYARSLLQCSSWVSPVYTRNGNGSNEIVAIVQAEKLATRVGTRTDVSFMMR